MLSVPPKISVPDKLKEVITLDKGTTLRLNVGVAGSFPIQALWFKDGVPVDISRKEVKTEINDAEAALAITGLTKLDEGVYSLHLKNEFGECKTNFTVKVRDSPDSPQKLEVTEIHSDRVTLTWAAPKSDGGAPVTKYTVEKRDASRNKWISVGSTDKLCMEVGKLFEGSSYFFKVTAYNEVGAGTPVETTEPITAKSSFSAPQPPGQPQGSNITKTSCILTWTTPVSDGGQPIVGYVVERKEKMSTLWAVITKDPVKTTTFTVDDLMENFEYEFRVIAINKKGRSDLSAVSATIKAKDPFNAPSAPGGPKVDNLSKDSVTLNWSSPTSDGGSPVLHYQLEYKMIDAFKWTTLEQNIETTTYSISGLTEGQSYVFRVYAVNAGGQSKPSDMSDPITIQEPIGLTLQLVEPLKNVLMKIGKDAYFECKIMAEPTPTVKWTRNGQELKGNRYDIIINKRTSALTIKTCEENDKGQYECIITNEFGSVKTSAKLTVEGTAHLNYFVSW